MEKLIATLHNNSMRAKNLSLSLSPPCLLPRDRRRFFRQNDDGKILNIGREEVIPP